MSNKRDLKKIIRNTSGGLALDMVNAGELFPPRSNPKDVEQIVYDCALLQLGTPRRLSIAFDRSRQRLCRQRRIHTRPQRVFQQGIQRPYGRIPIKT